MLKVATLMVLGQAMPTYLLEFLTSSGEAWKSTQPGEITFERRNQPFDLNESWTFEKMAFS